MNDRSEQEQLEELKAWWQENRWYIIGGLALGIAVMVGWNVWQDRRAQSGLEASNLYESLVEQITEDNIEPAAELAGELYQRYDATPYAAQARLAMAQLYMDRGRDQDAADALRPLATGGDEVLNLVARLRLANILLYQDQPQQVIELIGTPGETAFKARFNEVLGDAHRALGNVDEASEAYQAVLADASAAQTVNTRLVRMKLDDLPPRPAASDSPADEAPPPADATNPEAPPPATTDETQDGGTE